eukprot:462433_1
MASCLVEFLCIVLFLSILIGSKVVAISASSAVESIALDDYFNVNCISAVNMGILKPSSQEIWTMLGVSFCGIFFDIVSLIMLAAADSCDGNDKLTAFTIYCVCSVQSIEILVYFAILIHFNLYIDGLKSEFINKSLVNCSEYYEFENAGYWSYQGVWFCASAITASLIFVCVSVYKSHNYKEAIKKEKKPHPNNSANEYQNDQFSANEHTIVYPQHVAAKPVTLMNEQKNNVPNNKEHQFPNCSGMVSGCDALDNLSLVMSGYMNMSKMDLDQIDIGLILNNFLHLISEHDGDEEFESIYNKISGVDKKCNVLHCNLFNRNHRNRNENKSLFELFETKDITEMVKMQILDKIHCYYTHCYDIGHRLTIKEKEKAQYHQIDNLVTLLSNKHKRHQNRKSRFVSTIDEKMLKPEQFKMYDFGIPFHYEFTTDVKNKYNSLKQELTSNQTATISPDQFDCELEKATLHFHSDYCQKTLIKPYKEKWEDNQSYTLCDYIEITVEHILAILIYCNFDALSYQFSKTYRAINDTESYESIIARHVEFYFLGTYLKHVVHRLGTCTRENKIKRFYHGISERLLFPLQHKNKLQIPLSTSSEMAVAVNFSDGKGLIIEFLEDPVMGSMYFSTWWCSDYGNENEHLFIQMEGRLRFDNIFDVTTAYNFSGILGGINMLNGLICTSNAPYNVSNLITAYRLVQDKTRMEEWKGLHSYAKQLFHEYCDNITEVYIEWKIMSGLHGVYFYYLLSSDKYDGINIVHLNALLLNLNKIKIYEMAITPLLFEDILHLFMVNPHSKIKYIFFGHVVEVQDNNLNDIVTNYEKKFADIGFTLKRRDEIGFGVCVEITCDK